MKCATSGQGSFEGEKKEIVRRANYLTAKVASSAQQLLDEMPSGIGTQFQGEWALYTCSMTCAALANIAILYPQNKETAIKFIGQIIDIAMSEPIPYALQVNESQDSPEYDTEPAHMTQGVCPCES